VEAETEFLPKEACRHTFVANDDASPGCNKAKADSGGTWRRMCRIGHHGFGLADKQSCDDDPAKGKLRIVKTIMKMDWPTDEDAKWELEALDVFSDPLNLEVRLHFLCLKIISLLVTS
jgi:hypothetical protein